MDWKVFFLRVTVALALGALVGAERQLRQRLAGLRTNALVSTGAALFVMVSLLTSEGDHSGAARIAAQVVSGIGFLGAGVIMREGLNVRGLNTAATLWCSAAIGILSGMGHMLEAAIGTLVVLCANILLREAAQRINRQGATAAVEVDQRFTFNIVCRAEDEVHVRTLVLHGLNGSALRLQSLHSEDLANPDKLEVRAELVGTPASPAQLEQLASRVSLEKGVSSVRWQLLNSNQQDE
ncbi:MgtC/SapB family protein [Pseudomonas sp. ZT5P21]